jgi:hypothetical protein
LGAPTQKPRQRLRESRDIAKQKQRFTDRFLRGLKPEDWPYTVGNTDTKGMTIKVMPSGIKSFLLQYHSRVTGAPRTLTLGRYPDVTLAQANRTAAKAWTQIMDGRDPQLEKVQARKRELLPKRN